MFSSNSGIYNCIGSTPSPLAKRIPKHYTLLEHSAKRKPTGLSKFIRNLKDHDIHITLEWNIFLLSFLYNKE